MKQIKGTTQKMLELIEFAESNGWSEEELAKVIKLLHSEMKDKIYFSSPANVSKVAQKINEHVQKNLRG